MSNLVAVYGTLKQMHGNHACMVRAGGELVATTITKGKYCMYDGGFPMVTKEELSPIHIEVYQIKDLAPLDSLEGHPTFYKRELIDVVGVEDKVWMYFIDDITDYSWRGSRLPEGKWPKGDNNGN